MRSSLAKPASAAIEVSETTKWLAEILVCIKQDSETKKTRRANKAFIVTPATKIMLLFHFLILLKFRESSMLTPSGVSVPSPTIETYPPKGIERREKRVSAFFLLKDNNLGPKPIENSKQ